MNKGNQSALLPILKIFISLWVKPHIYLAAYHILSYILHEIPAKEAGKEWSPTSCGRNWGSASVPPWGMPEPRAPLWPESRVLFPPTVSHSRMTVYYAISRLVNGYDLALRLSKSAYRLARAVWMLLIGFMFTRTDTASSRDNLVAHDPGDFSSGLQLRGVSWSVMYLLVP